MYTVRQFQKTSLFLSEKKFVFQKKKVDQNLTVTAFLKRFW